ncbi:hypothetical protein CesoFtcFv8_020342 [Champsocephalus esox]|uniref:Uncharacterized protein n=2 Tax=Champsocephalus esox TaxID=159716 RepID=A0AAN8GNK1_9TELE|nr:hypothetical protein CesoFtcFv8_020342 [Champsocephalus esox]
MNFCIPDMYEMPHSGNGGFAVQAGGFGGGEHCMFQGEGPGFGYCDSQPLHHLQPPCMEQTWPPNQQFSCAFAGGPPAFKNEFCNRDVPLSHFQYQQQPEFFPEISPDFAHLQWMQGENRRGMASGG